MTTTNAPEGGDTSVRLELMAPSPTAGSDEGDKRREETLWMLLFPPAPAAHILMLGYGNCFCLFLLLE